MKNNLILGILILLSILSLTQCKLRGARLEGNNILVTYIDRLTSYWGDKSVAAAIGVPGYATPSDYNVINLAFGLKYGFADAASVWANPFGFMEQNNNIFGKTKEAVQKKWVELYHNAGIKIMLSVFGATEFPTSSQNDPVQECSDFAHFVKDNFLDGIDLDYEDNEAMNKGTGEEWIIKCTKAIREILPVGEYILTHAPQAPYFKGPPRYQSGGYVKVDQEVGNLIDWYNMQFYNQGDTTYDTYELLFIDAKYGEFNGTAVKQIADKGVPINKLVVGKPVTTADASNTGWVSANNLHNWASQAYADIQWSAGLMDWQKSSDPQGTFVKTYLYGN